MKLGIHFGDFTLPGAPDSLGPVLTALDVLSGGRAQLGLGAAWCEREHLGLGVPFVVGGGGERKTLRLVAQYADACNLVAVSPEVVAHKLDVLRRHCDAVGRDEAEVQKTILVLGINPVDDVDAFLAAMEPYARMGVELVEIPPQGQDPAGDGGAARREGRAEAGRAGRGMMPPMGGDGMARRS